jgi:hypothetical protein
MVNRLKLSTYNIIKQKSSLISLFKKEIIFIFYSNKFFYISLIFFLLLLSIYYFLNHIFGITIIDVILSTPLIEISIIIITYSSQTITKDINSGFFDLIRLGPSNGFEYGSIKIICGIIQYLILSFIFILTMIPISWAYGSLILFYAIISVLGFYLLFLLFFSSLLMIFSFFIKKENICLFIGCLISTYLILSSRPLDILSLNNLGLNFNLELTSNILNYYSGNEINIFEWSSFLFLTIITNIYFLFQSQYEWRRKR